MFIYRYHKHLPMQTYMGLKLYCFLCIFLLTFVHVSLEGKLSIQYAFTFEFTWYTLQIFLEFLQFLADVFDVAMIFACLKSLNINPTYSISVRVL